MQLADCCRRAGGRHLDDRSRRPPVLPRGFCERIESVGYLPPKRDRVAAKDWLQYDPDVAVIGDCW